MVLPSIAAPACSQSMWEAEAGGEWQNARQTSLKGERFHLDFLFKGPHLSLTVITVRTSEQQEREAAGHITFSVQKQRGMKARLSELSPLPLIQDSSQRYNVAYV